MERTLSLSIFELKINTLKKTTNYLNALIFDGSQLLEQYPDFVQDNSIFNIDDAEEQNISAEEIKKEILKLVFLNLIIYFEEYIKSIIKEILDFYKINHIGYISGILKTNYINWYKFLKDVFNDNDFSMSKEVKYYINIRNDIMHSKKCNTNINTELLMSSFKAIEIECQRLNELVIMNIGGLETY